MLFGGKKRWSWDPDYFRHDIRWYERQANKFASEYFKNNYDVEWDEEYLPIYIPLKYEHRDRPSTLTIKKY